MLLQVDEGEEKKIIILLMDYNLRVMRSQVW